MLFRSLEVCSKLEYDCGCVIPQSGPKSENTALRYNQPKVITVGNRVFERQTFEKAVEGMPPDLAKYFADNKTDVNVINAFTSSMANVISVKRIEKDIAVSGFVIKGLACIVPFHFFANFDSERLVVETAHTAKIEIIISKSDIVFDQENDVAMFSLPKYVAPFKSIMHHFIQTLSDYPKDQCRVMLGQVHISDNKFLFTNQMYDSFRMVSDVQYPSSTTGESTHIVLKQAGMYNGETYPGLCGAIIYAESKTLGRRALGMHVAGAGGRTAGICTLLPRDYLEGMLDQLRTIAPDSSITVAIPEIGAFDSFEPLWPHEAHDPLCRVKPITAGADSVFVPSIIAGEVYPIEKIPAALRPVKHDGVKVIPMDAGKIDFRNDAMEQPILDQALMHFHLETLKETKNNYAQRLLTVDECVNGLRVDGKTDPWLGGMEMKTSPGLPWCAQPRSATGKYDLVTRRDDDTYELKSDVLERMSSLDASLLKDEIEPVYFVDTLKDELVSLEKRSIGKTRVFNVGSFHFNLLCRKYFGMYIAELMDIHNNAEVKVGLNVHSTDWKVLYQYLTAHVPNGQECFIAGDWKHWDKSLPYQLCMTFVTAANRWYSDEYYKQRRALGILMFSSLRVNQGQVHRTFGSLPSGVVMTAVGNSVINAILTRYLFAKHMRDVHGCLIETTMGKFSTIVRSGYYGDDNIHVVSTQYSHVFNAHMLRDQAVALGMTYTAADKASVLPMFEPIERVSFIKRIGRASCRERV